MKDILNKLLRDEYLDRDDAKTVLHNIAVGAYNDTQIAALVTVYLMRSISIDELLGFRDALLDMRHPIDLSEYNPIDIVGTGGDSKNTFNISTAACFVVAGAGYKVVKHGNYGSTSISGASNLIEHYGVRFSTDIGQHRRSIEGCNMGYLHAPLFNDALKAVAPIRKAMGIRTFFNILGPLVNPSMPGRQLLGVYSLSLARLYSYTLQQSGVDFAVVHTIDGCDEISLTDRFKVVTSDSEMLYEPEDLGYARCTDLDLDAGPTVSHAARIFDDILCNRATAAQHNAVEVNAAFAIGVINPAMSIDRCIAAARESIASGAAARAFRRFVELNS